MNLSRTFIWLGTLLLGAALIIGFWPVTTTYDPAPPTGYGWMDGGPVTTRCGAPFTATETSGNTFDEHCVSARGDHLGLAGLFLGAGLALTTDGLYRLRTGRRRVPRSVMQ